MSVSAQEYLDFENRQPVSTEILAKVREVVINVHAHPEFGILAATSFEVEGMTVDEVRAKTESEMVRLSMNAQPHYIAGERYMVGYDYWGKNVNGVDGGLIRREDHHFDFTGEVPVEQFTSNQHLLAGHFYLPGIKRVRVRGSYVGDEAVFNIEDSDLYLLALRLRSDIVQFTEGYINTLRSWVTEGFFEENVRIILEYHDGTIREYDLWGNPIENHSQLSPTVEYEPNLMIAVNGEQRTITLVGGEPNTNYVIEESHVAELGWELWRVVTTDSAGEVSTVDNRSLPFCFFRVR